MVEVIEEDITEYKAINLEPLSITTATIAYDSNLRMPYEELSMVKSDDVKILAVKSTCLDLLDCVNGGKYTRAVKIIKKRERNKNKRGSLYGKPSRTLSGNQLYFQSSVEFVHSYYDGKYHNIRISPARGSIQIQGIKAPIFEVAETQIRSTLNYINNEMQLQDSYDLFNRRVIIVNTKSSISSHLMKPNLLIKIHKVSKLFQNLMN